MSYPETPIILVGAIDDSKFADLYEAITSTSGIVDLSFQHGYPADYRVCKIDTKYYRTVVKCHPLNCPTLSIESIVYAIEVVVLHLDHPRDSLEKELAAWEPVLHRVCADSKILASKHSIPEDQKEAVQAWCIKNECELIELDNDGNAIADDLGGKFGIERLVEALQAREWSIMEPKSVTMNEFYGNSISSSVFGDGSHLSPFNVPTNTPNETSPEYDTDTDCSEEDKMDDLYGTFKTMKSEISKLDRLERLKRAEETMKIIMASIGENIDDSDSDNE